MILLDSFKFFAKLKEEWPWLLQTAGSAPTSTRSLTTSILILLDVEVSLDRAFLIILMSTTSSSSGGSGLSSGPPVPSFGWGGAWITSPNVINYSFKVKSIKRAWWRMVSPLPFSSSLKLIWSSLVKDLLNCSTKFFSSGTSAVLTASRISFLTYLST